MKILTLLLLLTLPAAAQLDKQRNQTGAKYGNPDQNLLITRYRKDNCRIEAVLREGVVIAITYRMTEKPPGWKPRQMTLQELERYLGHNKEAGAWEKTGPRSWRHVREKKSAAYVDEDHILYVWKDLYNDTEYWDRWVKMFKGPKWNDEDEISDYERIRDVVCKGKEDK
jgi:hypothetical protein